MKSTYTLRGDDIRRGKERVHLETDVPCEVADDTICGRTHVPGVSCEHLWLPETGFGPGEFGPLEYTGRYMCKREDCGAIIERDPHTGEILDYDATAIVKRLDERDRQQEATRQVRMRKTA